MKSQSKYGWEVIRKARSENVDGICQRMGFDSYKHWLSGIGEPLLDDEVWILDSPDELMFVIPPNIVVEYRVFDTVLSIAGMPSRCYSASMVGFGGVEPETGDEVGFVEYDQSQKIF